MVDSPTLTHDGWRLLWRAPDGHTFPLIRGGDGPETDTLEIEIADLRTQIRAREAEEHTKREQADEMLEKFKKDGVTLASATDEQFAELDGVYQEPDRLRDEITGLRSRLQRSLEIATSRGGTGRSGPDPSGPGRGREGGTGPRMRLGSRFTESAEYKRLKDSGVLNVEGSRVDTQPIELLTRDELHDLLKQRTTVDVTTGGSLVPLDQRVWPPIEKPVRPVRLLDMITIGDTDGEIVKWVKQTVRTDAATNVAFGTAAPEADYEFALQSSTVRRITQFIPGAKDVLADQGQLQTLIEQQLMTGVRLRAEAQVLNGDGIGENFLGILQTSGINTVNVRDGSHSTEYDLDALHRAVTAVRLGIFGEPDGIGLHPTDLETINLQKDGQGRYIFPPGQEIETLWGLVPVVTPLFTQGTALVGDYDWATLWLREGVMTNASDGYMDFFTRGLVAILAQLRGAFAVQQPAAFTKVVGL